MGRGRQGDGVEVLKTTIRVRFTWQGKRHAENLSRAPTPPNIRWATHLLAKVRRLIDAGVFDSGAYIETFPDSKLAMTTTHKVLFGDYAEGWLATKHLSRATRENYSSRLSAWKAALGPTRPLLEIRHTDLATALAGFSETLEGRTVNGHLTVIRGVFEAAMADQVITTNPTDLLKNRKTRQAAPDPFDIEEAAKIREHLSARAPAQVANYFDLAFTTGLRTSELLALSWDHVNWKGRTLLIKTALVRNVIKGTKTHQVRDVDLNDQALAALERQRAYTFMKGVAGVRVFHNPATGRPWVSGNDLRDNYFTPALRSLGLRRRAAYQTRHTFATTLLMGGVNIAYISRQLGHSSVTTTLTYYAKWIDMADKGREAAKANALFGQQLATTPPNALK